MTSTNVYVCEQWMIVGGLKLSHLSFPSGLNKLCFVYSYSPFPTSNGIPLSYFLTPQNLSKNHLFVRTLLPGSLRKKKVMNT